MQENFNKIILPCQFAEIILPIKQNLNSHLNLNVKGEGI